MSEKKSQRPPAYEIVARNQMILQMSLQGATSSDIAKDVDLTVRQVRNVLAAEGERGKSLIKQGPGELIEKWLSGNEASALFYASIAADPNVELSLRIAAMAKRDDVSAKTMKALSQLHLLPRHLGTLRNIIDFQRLAGQIVEKLEAVERGELSAEQAVADFRQYGKIGQPDGPTVLPSGEVVVAEAVEEPESAPKKPTRRKKA